MRKAIYCLPAYHFHPCISCVITHRWRTTWTCKWHKLVFQSPSSMYDHIPWVTSLYIIVTTPLNKSSLWVLVSYGQSCERHVHGCQGIQLRLEKEKKAGIAGTKAGARHCTEHSVCNISLVTLTVPLRKLSSVWFQTPYVSQGQPI